MKACKWLLATVLVAFIAANVSAAGRGRIDSLSSLDKIKSEATTVQQVREVMRLWKGGV